MSPRLFTKVLKPVFAALKRAGHQSVIYIDDVYLQGDTVNFCNQNVIAISNSLVNCGFVINPEKSAFSASQEIEYLGFVLNSVDMTISITTKKKQKNF